jgi:ribosomal protein S18 acetylase RimI-like enzyme
MSMAQCHAHYSTFARIHRAGRSELAELRSLAASLGQPEHSFDWSAALVGTHVVFLAFEGGVLAGAIAGWCDPARVEAELDWIGVVPSARRRGIGRLLVEHLADALRARGAATLAFRQDEPSVGALLLACGATWRNAGFVLPLGGHLHLVGGQ